MGNYLISKKPGRQVVSFLFSTKEGGRPNAMKNVGTRKQFNLTQDDVINVARDEMTEMNEVGEFLYTT